MTMIQKYSRQFSEKVAKIVPLYVIRANTYSAQHQSKALGIVETTVSLPRTLVSIHNLYSLIPNTTCANFTVPQIGFQVEIHKQIRVYDIKQASKDFSAML